MSQQIIKNARIVTATEEFTGCMVIEDGVISSIAQGNTAVAVTLSCGLAEHHAGEAVSQTLERAKRALDDAKAQGRDRIAVAA